MTLEPFSIAVWNAEWAVRSSSRGRSIRAVLADLDADVIVLTEGSARLLPDAGHVIDGGVDWGYPVDDPERRKVLAWSKHPWLDVDASSDSSMPPGRFVGGTTQTSVGAVRVIGVCIPWSRAHVSTGRRDREPWVEHLDHLRGLQRVLAVESGLPTIVAGDFNQRIPRTRQPVEVANALGRALDGFTLLTGGEVDGRQLIDHVAVRGLAPIGPPTVIDRRVSGSDVSDHDGVVVEVH